MLHPNETVIDHTKGQSGGQAGRVDVFVHPSGEFDARVEGTAARVMGAGLQQYDRNLNARIAEYQRDPRKR